MAVDEWHAMVRDSQQLLPDHVLILGISRVGIGYVETVRSVCVTKTPCNGQIAVPDAQPPANEELCN